jgi:PKD repeat protein
MFLLNTSIHIIFLLVKVKCVLFFQRLNQIFRNFLYNYYHTMKKTLLLMSIIFLLGKITIAQTPQYYNTLTYDWNLNATFGNVLGKIQYLVTPDQFPGSISGNITKLYFKNGSTLNTTANVTGTLKLGLVSQTVFASNTDPFILPAQLTTVLTNYSVTASATGNTWFSITLPTPFYYDRTKVLVVEMTTTASSSAFNIAGGTITTLKTIGNAVTTATSGDAAFWGTLLFPSIGVDVVAALPPVIPPPLATFANSSTDTIWISSPKTIVNTSNGADRSYWDIIDYSATSKTGPYTAYPATRMCKTSQGIDACFLDTNKYVTNFPYVYDQAGYYRVKVTAVNQYGNDTYIDTIYVDTPSTKPVSEFFIDKRVIGVGDFGSCFDLSSNGPTNWYWYLVNNTPNTNPLFPNRFTPQATSQNPKLNAFEGGTFDLCLVTSNLRGTDTICKKSYVRVIPGYPACAGVSAEKDTIARDMEGTVVLSTVGGIYFPSLVSACSKGFTISTCSDMVELNMERFKMRVNVTGTTADSLLIHIGNKTGTVVARYGGVTIPPQFKVVNVPGGIAYLEVKLAATTGNNGDSGFAVRWSSVPPTYSKPHAAFSMPDTIYDKTKVQFVNQSTGVNAKYSWDTDGDGHYGIDEPTLDLDSTTTNPSRSYNVFAEYWANICLKSYNCVGADTACKRIKFLPINSAPISNFTVNRNTGFTTDTFRFKDNTQNGATSWSWSFLPDNVAYLLGTNAGSQNPIVLLNSATAYQVTLTVTNAKGQSTEIKPNYVTAIAYTSPGCSNCQGNFVPTTIDIGISRVTLANMDTATALGTPVYHALYTVKQATLYRGVSYTLSTARLTATEGMSTRGWIDFNHSTVFGDQSNEVIISETDQFKTVTTGSFTVPSDAPIGNTRMRIGVTLGSTAISDQVATLGCFEDYGIIIAMDYTKPTLSLRGLSIEKTEVNKPYDEQGVNAWDNLENDISSRYQVIGTVNTAKVGYYELKYIVADLYGNVSDTAYRTVQVEINQTGPTVQLNGPDTIKVDVNTGYSDQGATAHTNTGEDISSLMSVTGVVDTTRLGTYIMSYSSTDQFGFTDTAYRWVIVQDTIKPVITSKAGSPLFTHQVNAPYLDPINVTDNYWKNIKPVRSGPINPEVRGTYNLQYNATDSSGNAASTYFATVEVKDLIPPTVTLEGENPMTVDVFTQFNDPGVTAKDNYFVNVTTVRTGLPTMTTLGPTTIIYTCTDGDKNSTVVTRVVNVVDRIAPEITLSGLDPVTHPRFKPYTDAGVTLKDNFYSQAAMQSRLTVDQSGLDVTRPGLYYVVYNLTDPSGNKAQTVKRLVKVEEDFTGISEASKDKNISIYPNPSNGIFNITSTGNSNISRLRVVDIVGKVILELTVKTKTSQLDLSTFHKGVYFVEYQNEEGAWQTQKIMLN